MNSQNSGNISTNFHKQSIDIYNSQYIYTNVES